MRETNEFKLPKPTWSYLQIILELVPLIFNTACSDVRARHANRKVRHINPHQLQSLHFKNIQNKQTPT